MCGGGNDARIALPPLRRVRGAARGAVAAEVDFGLTRARRRDRIEHMDANAAKIIFGIVAAAVIGLAIFFAVLASRQD